MIPRTKEFFISLKDHDEWGVAHTVWGEVRTCVPFATFEHECSLPGSAFKEVPWVLDPD